MSAFARGLYQGIEKRVGVPLPPTLPGYAVFPWVRRVCVDRVIARHFPGLHPRDLVQRFEGFRLVQGMLTAVYVVGVK